MICKSLRTTREYATQRVFDTLKKEQTYYRFQHNIDTIYTINKAYDKLVDQYSGQLNICNGMILKLKSRDIDAVIKTKGVFNMKGYIVLCRRNQRPRAEQYLKESKENKQVESFSTTNEFETLMKHLMAIDFHKICLVLPTKSNETQQYIQTHYENGTLFHLHSPPCAGISPIYGMFNLLFLGEFLNLIPHITRPWIDGGEG